MSEIDLDALKALAEKATRGDWQIYGDEPFEIYDATEYADGDQGEYITHGSPRKADAEFIVALVNAWPALLARVEEAERAIADAQDAFRAPFENTTQPNSRMTRVQAILARVQIERNTPDVQ